jgi:hypothetical protein
VPYDNIVVDSDIELKTAVWHTGVSTPLIIVPGWDTTNELGIWIFTNNDFTGEMFAP